MGKIYVYLMKYETRNNPDLFLKDCEILILKRFFSKKDHEIFIYEVVICYQSKWWKRHGKDGFEIDIEGTKEIGLATKK